MKRIAIIALCALPALPMAQTALSENGQTVIEDDQGYLTRLIEDKLSDDNQTVNVEGFQGALSSEATIRRLTISDKQGEWLVLEGLQLNWTRSALLLGRVSIQSLAVDRIAYLRSPQSTTQTPQAEATPLRLPSLPVSVNIGNLEARKIEIGPDLLGQAVTLALTGNVALGSGTLDTNISAQRIDGKTGEISIVVKLDESAETLTLDLVSAEGPNGIAVTKLNIPGLPSSALAISGSGPLSNFHANLSLKTDGKDRISGDLAITDHGFDADISGDISPLFAPDYQDFFGPNVAIRAAGQRGEDGGLTLDQFAVQAQALNLHGTVEIAPDGWPNQFNLQGNLGADDGSPVLLPISGPRTTVTSGTLNVQYDAAASEAWTGTFDIADFERESLSIAEIAMNGGGVIDRAGTSKPRQWTVAMDYSTNGIALTDPGAALALGSEIAGRLEAVGTKGQPTQIPSLTISGPGVEAQANATIAGGEKRFDTTANISLQSDDLARLSALTGLDMSGSGAVDIRLMMLPLDADMTVSVTGHTNDLTTGIPTIDPLISGVGKLSLQADRDTTGTRLDTFVLTTPQVKVTADADLTSGVANANFRANVLDTSVVSDDLQGPATITASAQRRKDGRSNLKFDAILPEGSAKITGFIANAEQGFETDLNGRLSLTNLAVYSDLFGRNLNGQVSAFINGGIHPESGAFDISFNGTSNDLAFGQAQIDALITGAGRMSGQLGRDDAGTVHLTRFHLKTPAMTAAANGQLQNGIATADLNARIDDASIFAPDLDGAITLIGNAKQSADGNTVVKITADAPQTDIRIDAQVAPPARNYSTRFTASAQIADLAPYGGITGQAFDGSAQADITGTIMPQQQVFDVSLSAETQNLALGNDAIDEIMRGKGTLTLKAARDLQGNMALNTFEFQTAQAIAEATAALTDGKVTADLSGRVHDIRNLAPGLSGTAELRGAAMQQPDGRTKITLSLNDPASTLTIDGMLDTPENGYAATYRADAQINRFSAYRSLIGQPVSGSIRFQADGTGRPKRGLFDTNLTLTTSNLAIGNDAADPLLRGAGRGTARIRRLDGGKMAITGADLRIGAISASGNATYGKNGITGDFDAGLRDLGLLTPNLQGAVSLTGSAQHNNNGRTTLNLSAQGPGGTQARAQGTLFRGRLNMDIDGQSPFAMLNTFIEPRSLDGNAQINLSVNGPPALSSVSGTITTNGARLAIPSLGEAVNNITGGVTLSGGRAVTDLTATVTRGGSLALKGPITLSGVFPAQLALTAKGVVIQDPELFQTKASGQIDIRGPIESPSVSGKITLDRTEIRVPSTDVAGLADLPEIRHLDPSQTTRATLERAGLSIAGIDLYRGGNDQGDGASARTEIPLNLAISAPSRIFIRGRGLDAELGGALSIKGTSRNIIPSGRFELVRGRLDILQQRFNLTEGYATLDGDFTPYLRLVATTETDDGILVSIIAEGNASQPEISFTSAPELPQDEVLAQLLFGRDLSSISPLQAVQLASAVNTLAGGTSMIGQFRESIGLDDLDLTTDSEGNTAVRAGKYISDNVYTDITVDSAGTSKINLNLDVSKEITVRGGTSSDGESSLGIFYEKDY